MNDIWGLDNLDNELTGELTLVVPGVFKLLEYKSLSLDYHFYLTRAVHEPALLQKGGQSSLSAPEAALVP